MFEELKIYGYVAALLFLASSAMYIHHVIVKNEDSRIEVKSDQEKIKLREREDAIRENRSDPSIVIKRLRDGSF